MFPPSLPDYITMCLLRAVVVFISSFSSKPLFSCISQPNVFFPQCFSCSSNNSSLPDLTINSSVEVARTISAGVFSRNNLVNPG